MIDGKKLEYEFKKYMDMYKADPELGQLMLKLSYQELFNDKFMRENSKFSSMDDMLFKSDFGLTNPAEIENVNQAKWNAFIAAHTDCADWHQFGKLAMVDWMKTVIELLAQVKAKEKKTPKKASEKQNKQND